MKKKIPRRFVTNRDLEVLKFLWRWKAASTLAIAKRFFPKARPFTAYERLLKLEKARYIKCVPFRHRMGFVWTLNTPGFRFVQPYLVEMKNAGFASENILHDFYATAFHLGEWLTAPPVAGYTCTEQELRCLDPGLLPTWVPAIGNRRPDGYSLKGSGEKARLYAFEAELTLKSRSRYDEIFSFYDEEQSISHVFWLLGSTVIEAVLRERHKSRPEIHHFVQLADFKKTGWNTPLRGGNLEGRNLAEILLDGSPTEATRLFNGSDAEALLRNHKRPIL